MEGRYPYYIHDLKDEEKVLILKLFSIGKKLRLIEQKRLEQEANFSLRYIIGGKRSKNDDVEDAERRKAGPSAMDQVPHYKWVFLYNYAMTKLFNIAMAALNEGPERKSILEIYDQLNVLAEKSGRYDNDMHIFNRDIILNEIGYSNLEEKFYGSYFVFRYSSDVSQIVVSFLRIMRQRERDVFGAIVFRGATERETRGFVYQLVGRIYLYGFMNENHGGESFVFYPDDIDHNILFGVMTTVDGNGQPHSKTCVCIRVELLNKNASIPDSLYGQLENKSPSEKDVLHLRKLLNKKHMDEESLSLSLSDGKKLHLSQYISKNIVMPINNRRLAGGRRVSF